MCSVRCLLNLNKCVCKYFQLECRLAVNIFRAKIDANFDFHKNAGVNLVEKNEFFTIKEREREKVVASPLHLIVGKYFEIKLKREQTWRGTECVWACVCVHTLRLHLNIHFLLSHKCRCVGRIRSNFDWNCLCAIVLGIGKTIDEMTLLVYHKTVFVFEWNKRKPWNVFHCVFVFAKFKIGSTWLDGKTNELLPFHSILIHFHWIYMQQKGKRKKRKRKTTNCAKRNPFFVSHCMIVCVFGAGVLLIEENN